MTMLSKLTFRGLFWRIFLATWLTNLAVLFAASYLIVAKIESTRFQDHLEEKTARFAQYIVAETERRQAAELPPPSVRSLLKSKDWHRLKLDELTILDSTGEPVFHHSRRKVVKTSPFRLTITSPSGAPYTVQSYTPPPPDFFIAAMRKLQSLRLILILVASTVASAILSWTLARPLRSLSRYTRAFAEGTTAITLPPELQQRRDEIGDLAREFQAMTEEVEATLSRQKQLLHDVSHELRAPLARLQAAVAIQEQQLQDNPYNAIIHREMTRINDLIQHILDFSRMEQTVDTAELCDLVPLVQGCVEDIRMAEPARIFNVQAAEQMQLLVTPSLLCSALDNVLTNACKYSPAETPVDVRLEQQPESVTITVRDYGQGVKNTDLTKLGTPFFRADSRPQAEGYGLGLSIARKAIERHGGKLLFSNASNGGLIVAIQLPRDTA